MARAQLEYDESGSTFYYFLISFYGLILLPITYFLWPRKDDDGKGKGLLCHCEPCQTKRTRLDTEQPKKRFKVILKYVVIFVLWAILFVMIYKVLTLEKDYIEYDPFEILQLDPGASVGQIKKQYRKLSKVYHPDKEGGDQDMFMKIAKAYEALTDDVARENWEKYGNPDGPQAATFGIALPSWIVSEENSIWLLVIYIGVFVFGLPIIVGVWWYSSIKYGMTNVLIQTSQLFFYFFSRNKNIPIKRAVAILTCAAEFNPQMSQVIKARPSDDFEITEIIRMKLLPHIDFKTKERPFSAPYACKARILAHAHLEGYRNLPQNTLQKDQYALLKRCPQLIQEIMNLLGQVWYMAKSGRGNAPSLETFENVMKVSQMVVQGMWSRGNNCLFQMPHITSDQIKHFRTKKRNITSIEQFVVMKSDDRRALVRTLSDEEYMDIMAMCSMLPHVDIEAETQVVDDTDHDRITAGSLITLSVTLYRTSLLDHCGLSIEDLVEGSEANKEITPVQDGHIPDDQDDTAGVETIVSGDRESSMTVARADTGSPQTTSQKKSWEKNKKKKKGKGGAGASKSKKKAQQKKGAKKAGNSNNALQEEKTEEEQERNDEGRETLDSEDEKEETKVENKRSTKGKKKERVGKGGKGGGEERSGKNSKLRHRTTTVKSNKNATRREGQSSDEESDSDEGGEGGEGKDEEEEWKSLQESMQKHQKKKFDSINTKSFPVHAPYFPDEKQECWWLLVADKKRREVITPPQRITGLRDKHSTDLQFVAPEKPGFLRYTVYLVSDSYVDMTFSVELKLKVEEKQEVKGTDQWKDLEEEEEEEEMIEDSEEESEGVTETDSDD